MPLFVFMAGSPFFLKNFMHTLGHFDIYGCAFAIGLLLMPARSVAFVVLAALASMILILIHHIHLLMYVPTIAVIVVLRYYLVQGFDRQNVARRNRGDRWASACCSSPRSSGERWRCRRKSSSAICRAGWPIRRGPNLLSFSYIWYQPLAKEIQRYLGADAVEPAGRSGVRAADLAACAALAIFCRSDPSAVG